MIEKVRGWRNEDGELRMSEIVSMLNDDAEKRETHVNKKRRRLTYYFDPVSRWMVANVIDPKTTKTRQWARVQGGRPAETEVKE